jgi:serine/threonine-protein kinase
MTEGLRAPDALIGSVLQGGYEVVRVLGRGGMGTVYEAIKLPLNNRVAVKVMAANLDPSAQGLQRFYREAEITSNLGHPHIVQVFDFGSTPTGEPFLAMEYLKGEDLYQRILAVGRLSPQQTLHIVRQVASALAAAHAQDIVHRDLKPGNVFILQVEGEIDFVKVLDFGISKARRGPANLTQNATKLGTPGYMSPEQALGMVDETDGATDQWALACIAWEMLSGEVPFGGEDSNAVLFQVVNVDPPSLTARVPGLPPEIELVLRRALSKSKHDRFPDITAFAQALESAVNGTANAPVVSKTVHMVVAPGRATVRFDSTVPAAATDGAPGQKPPSRRFPANKSDAGRSATTCSQTNGELESVTWRPYWRSKLLWIATGAAVLSVAALAVVLGVSSTGQSIPPSTMTESRPSQAILPAFVPPTDTPSIQPKVEALPAKPELATEPAAVTAPTVQGGGKAIHGKGKRAKTTVGKRKTSVAPRGEDTAPTPRPKIETNLIKEL